MSEKYQGWTNYETWNVKLWLDNDYGSYQTMTQLANDAIESGDDRDNVIYELAQQIEEMIEDSNPLQDDCSMYSDILTASLQSVNWQEIAEAYIDEITE